LGRKAQRGLAASAPLADWLAAAVATAKKRAAVLNFFIDSSIDATGILDFPEQPPHIEKSRKLPEKVLANTCQIESNSAHKSLN
jgi:hypothetical protein